jgi:uncharacterized protein
MPIQVNGAERISASQERVWAALNDPAVLQACIPGCEEINQNSPTEMSAVVRLKMGPIKARFNGAITLEDIDAPTSYSIVGEGKGGVAGFAKGRAHVRLTAESPDITLLNWEVMADVGGKIAQLGSRLMVSTTKKLSGEFFANFNSALSER